MKVRIQETGEIENLNYRDCKTGIDCTTDIIGNTGAIGNYIKWDEDEQIYCMAKDDFAWWEQYLDQLEKDEEKLQEYREKYGSDVVNDMIFRFDPYNGDYDYHHDNMKDVFAAIEEEYGEPEL